MILSAPLPTHAQVHCYGYLFASILYLGVFLSAIKKVILRAPLRNFFGVSVASLFFIVSVNFLTEAFSPSPWLGIKLEVFWLLAAVTPAVLFLCLRKSQTFILGADSAILSSVKFNRFKDEFLSVASHELRTPLSVINGFAEILVREKLGPLNDEQRRRMRKILMQAQRLTRIVDDLLDLSRLRSGKIDIHRDVFDLVPVLKASLDDHQVLCEQQNLEIHDEIPDVLPDVVGDLDRVAQIIVNLLNNSIKYTEPGGSITLSAAHEKSNSIRVWVKDTGIGIESKDQPHVFEEFYRANHEAKKYHGSGLGLAIVKQLVEAQGGKVGLESEGSGKGSLFFFTLPCAKVSLQDDPPRVAVKKNVEPAPASSRRPNGS